MFGLLQASGDGTDRRRWDRSDRLVEEKESEDDGHGYPETVLESTDAGVG
jgi:hypothetical protein